MNGKVASRSLQRLVLLALGALAAHAGMAAVVSLPGHVVKRVSQATPLAHTALMDQEPLTVTTFLRLADEPAATQWRRAFSDPASPHWHQPIEPDEFTARFGPSQDALDTVRGYFEQQGLEYVSAAANRQALTFRGTRAAVQRAFGVVVDDYQLGERRFHAIAADPRLPSAIAALIRTVSGLTNLAQPQAAATWNPPQAFVGPIAAAYDGTLTPAGEVSSGGLPPGLAGVGVTIGLLAADGFNPQDVGYWLQFQGLDSGLVSHVTNVPINGGVGISGCTLDEAGCFTTEILLDIGAALGTAQGASIRVYSLDPAVTDFPTATIYALAELATVHGAKVFSSSLGFCEDEISSSEAQNLDDSIANVATEGVTLFAATGDRAGSCHGEDNTISLPAAAPATVAVGGTALSVNPGSGSYSAEQYFGDPRIDAGGGFGQSQVFPAPSYQLAAFPGLAGRSVPDVSIMALPGLYVCQNEMCEVIHGTSVSAPLWAGVWAITLQAVMDAGHKPFALDHSALYRTYDDLPRVMHDPASMLPPYNDFFHVGLGSPNIANWVNAVAGVRVSGFAPAQGRGAGGTRITIHGAGFVAVRDVLIGGVKASNLSIDSDTELTVDAPAAAVASARVTVVTNSYQSSAAADYQYVPEVTSLGPFIGPLSGGQTITVHGRAFSASDTFFFGNNAATGVQCASSMQCTMVTPPGAAAGGVNIIVQTPDGARSPASPNDVYIYL